MKQLPKEQQLSALHTLHYFIQFAEWQKREGKIDGVCDPSLAVDIAKNLIKEFAPEILREETVLAEAV